MCTRMIVRIVAAVLLLTLGLFIPACQSAGGASARPARAGCQECSEPAHMLCQSTMSEAAGRVPEGWPGYHHD